MPHISYIVPKSVHQFHYLGIVEQIFDYFEMFAKVWIDTIPVGIQLSYYLKWLCNNDTIIKFVTPSIFL